MKLSVVIPVHNGGEDFGRCLAALENSIRPPDEIIIVDDASTEPMPALASRIATLVPSGGRQPVGPARARNRGVMHATGDILVFVDADVMVHQDTLARIEKHFVEQPGIAALFGSYDADPPHRSLISLYKNLQHHFVHHNSSRNPASFWTGLGAIRREVFLQLGGFNEKYVRPSIEDIELGVRLKEADYEVRLCPDVQATHLKRWSLMSLLRTDILDRAVPWTRLILSRSRLPYDLNLDFKSRMSAVYVWLLLVLAGLGFWIHVFWFGSVSLAAILIGTNFSLYRFFYERGGLWFAVGAMALHFLYFFYSSLTFGWIWVEQRLGIIQSPKFTTFIETSWKTHKTSR